jgi:hypothetical protein
LRRCDDRRVIGSFPFAVTKAMIQTRDEQDGWF